MLSLSADFSRSVGRLYSTRDELRESLLQRAMEGRSRYTVEQMRIEIDRRLGRCELSPLEKMILRDSRDDAAEPRSVRMLNTLARSGEIADMQARGMTLNRIRYHDRSVTLAMPAPAIVQ